MPKYVIERELPGASKLSPEELQAISRKPTTAEAPRAPRQAGGVS